MAAAVQQLKKKFNRLIKDLNNSRRIDIGFSTVVESGYEALVLAEVMKEYRRVYGPIKRIDLPHGRAFLNQKPGSFRTDRAFEVEFQSGEHFFFATDIELFGLQCIASDQRQGIKFEADVVVIRGEKVADVMSKFKGYPAPQHLHGVYECKFGKYNKGQLRELLGLRRHLSFLGEDPAAKTLSQAGSPHRYVCRNARPAIPVKMVRPVLRKFFDKSTADLYDLQQLDIF